MIPNIRHRFADGVWNIGKKKTAENIWPPQSPDCNPIYICFGMNWIKKQENCTAKQLGEILQNKWTSLYAEMLQKFVDRIRKVVIKAREHYFQENKI